MGWPILNEYWSGSLCLRSQLIYIPYCDERMTSLAEGSTKDAIEIKHRFPDMSTLFGIVTSVFVRVISKKINLTTNSISETRVDKTSCFINGEIYFGGFLSWWFFYEI